MCRSSEKLPVCKKFLTNLCLPKISGIDIMRPSKQRGMTVAADSNEFNLLSRRENVMNIKNILPTNFVGRRPLYRSNGCCRSVLLPRRRSRRHRQCRNRMDAAPNHAACFCERRGKRFPNRKRNQVRRLMIL